MFSLRDILLGVLLPAIISAIVLIVAWRPWRARDGGHWGPPLAIGLGFFAGVLGVFGLAKVKHFPPAATTDWVLFFAPALVALALLDVFLKPRFWLRWLVALGVSIVATWLVLRPLFRADADPPEDWRLIAQVSAAMFLAWVSLDLLTARVRGTSLPLILTLLAAITGAVVIMSGSQTLGQPGGALAAACGAMFVIAWWAGNVSLARGTSIVFVVLWMCVLMNGRFFSEVTPLHARLVYLSPFLTWVGEIPPLRGRPKARFIVRVIAVAIPLFVAGGLAGAAFAKSQAETSENYGD